MWKLEFLKDDARGPMFIEALNHLEQRVLHALLVPENLISGDSRFGGVSVQGDLFLMTEKSLVDDLEDAITDQIIRPFVEANYPPEKRKPASFKLDPMDWSRKIALKEIFMEMLRNNDSMIQYGAPPLIMPSVEKMAQILEIPIESFKDATGLSPEEYKETFLARNAGPMGGGFGEDGAEGEEEVPSGKDEKGKAVGSSVKKKGAGKLPHSSRTSTRAKNTPQTEERRRVNPSGKRAERNREVNPEKKK